MQYNLQKFHSLCRKGNTLSDIEIKKRSALLQQIESNRNSKAVLYVTGDRQELEAQIGQDIIDLFIDHLDEIGPVKQVAIRDQRKFEGWRKVA